MRSNNLIYKLSKHKLCKVAEDQPFISRYHKEEFNTLDHYRHLRQLLSIYEALENKICYTNFSTQIPIKLQFVLSRSEEIKKDLEFLKKHIPNIYLEEVLQTTNTYVDQLEKLDTEKEELEIITHFSIRILGDLLGGQSLKKYAIDAYKRESIYNNQNQGTYFYRFRENVLKDFLTWFRQLDLNEDEILNIATDAFQKHINMFVELESTRTIPILKKQQTSEQDIRKCLRESIPDDDKGIEHLVESIHFGEKPRIDILEEISTNKCDNKPEMVCLVDDDRKNCKDANNKGFEAIRVLDVKTDRKVSYISTPNHLNNVLHESINEVDATKNAIEEYKNKRDNHLSFFSQWFDKTRGEKRANTYLYLLDMEHQTALSRLTIIYALLTSRDGSTLQKNVYMKMGFNNRQSALDYFGREIKSELHKIHRNESDFNNAFRDLNEKVLGKIVHFANSDKDINEDKAREIMEDLPDVIMLDTKYNKYSM